MSGESNAFTTDTLAAIRRLFQTRRPIAAAALLLAVYAGLSFINDARGYLGTDTGGKVATLEVMDQRGELDPDIGYWAERWDPEGRFHPLWYTAHLGDKWVNVTTLPALYAAYPLYRLGGYRLALLLPMLGSVAAALAARALVRRIRPDGDGATAFWLVGLASPLTIYALDFWEHSLGVALIAWATVLLVDTVFDRARIGRAAAAGTLLGLAGTMRTEALVYSAALLGCAGLALLVRRAGLVRAAAVGVAVLVPIAVLWVANDALERATVGERIRATRATEVFNAGETGASRFEEAALTAMALRPALEPASYVLGAAMLAILVYAAARARPGQEGPANVVVAGAVAIYLLRFADGLGFVPGMVAATPIVAVALARGRRRNAALLASAAAVVALPVVWALQYQGGASPQWAGRYVLPSGLLLMAVGVAALPDLTTVVRRGFVVLSAAVTLFGLAWLVQRSHQFADASAALVRRPEPVLISRVAHLPREGGAFYGEKRWLTAITDGDVAGAAAVAGQAGAGRIGVVDLVVERELTTIPGWRRTGSSRRELVAGVDLRITSFVRSP